MKLQELKDISKSTSRSKKAQIKDILTLAEMAMIHSTVYGTFEIVEEEDHLVFHFNSEHYGAIQRSFQTREELELIKDNLKMAFYEVEDLTSTYRHENTITEELIRKANLFFNALVKQGILTIEEAVNEVHKLEVIERMSLQNLLEIYAHLNKQLLKVTFTGMVKSTANTQEKKRHFVSFKQFTKLA